MLRDHVGRLIGLVLSAAMVLSVTARGSAVRAADTSLLPSVSAPIPFSSYKDELVQGTKDTNGNCAIPVVAVGTRDVSAVAAMIIAVNNGDCTAILRTGPVDTSNLPNVVKNDIARFEPMNASATTAATTTSSVMAEDQWWCSFCTTMPPDLDYSVNLYTTWAWTGSLVTSISAFGSLIPYLDRSGTIVRQSGPFTQSGIDGVAYWYVETLDNVSGAVNDDWPILTQAHADGTYSCSSTASSNLPWPLEYHVLWCLRLS